MGIRFACHVCAKQLNIKEELAGKRGICPACSSKFRIPNQDAQRSLALEDSPKRAEPKKAESRPIAVAPATANQETNTKETAAQASASPAMADPSVAKPDVEIDLLSSDPDATWYVRPPSGGQYGPADGDVLRAWIGEGRVAATALLWRDGWPNWRTAKEVLPGLSGSSPARDSGPAAAPAPPQALTEPASVSLAAKSGAGQASGVGQPNAKPTSATPTLSGRSDVGTARRQKNGKRIFWIGTLSAIAIALIVVLVYLVWQGS